MPHNLINENVSFLLCSVSSKCKAPNHYIRIHLFANNYRNFSLVPLHTLGRHQVAYQNHIWLGSFLVLPSTFYRCKLKKYLMVNDVQGEIIAVGFYVLKIYSTDPPNNPPQLLNSICTILMHHGWVLWVKVVGLIQDYFLLANFQVATLARYR